MNPEVTMLLSNYVIKYVFKEVLKNRRIHLKQLRESLTEAPEIRASLSKEPELQTALSEPAAKKGITDAVFADVVQKKVADAVQQLKTAKLIDERPASIEDFNTYYVTENGLNAERELRQTATV